MNAVVVHGDAVGTTLYYGKGAGGEATASAVIADVVDVARATGNAAAQRVPALAFQPGRHERCTDIARAAGGVLLLPAAAGVGQGRRARRSHQFAGKAGHQH